MKMAVLVIVLQLASNIETTDISEDPYKDFGDELTLSSDDLPF